MPSLEKKPPQETESERGTMNLKSFFHDKRCFSSHLYENFAIACYSLLPPTTAEKEQYKLQVRPTHCKSINLSYDYLSYLSIIL